MNDPISDADKEAPRFRRAYESVLNEIRAVPEEDFVRISLNVTAAVTTVIGVLPKVRALGPQISWALSASCFPLARFDQMATYARALGHAQTLYETTLEQPASVTALAIKALADKVIDWRNILLRDLEVLIKRDLVDPAALGVLKEGNSYQSAVDDLFALANILRQNWTAASFRTAVTINGLDQAESLAGQLRTAIGEREHAVVTATQAARDRQAAFALFIGTYREIRSAIQCLRHKQGDLSAFAPSLYDGRSARKKKRSDEAQLTPAAPEPALVPAPLAATGIDTTTIPPGAPDSGLVPAQSQQSARVSGRRSHFQKKSQPRKRRNRPGW